MRTVHALESSFTFPPLDPLLSVGHALSVGNVRFSLTFSRGLCFYLQGSLNQRFDWDNPSSNIGASEAGIPVSPHFFFMKCWSDHLSILVLNECWPSAPLSHIFKRSTFIYRDLSHNKLDGTIPAAISTLVKLTSLYAHTFFNLGSVGQSILV